MNRTLRHNRIRKKIKGTKDRPRLSVFRSSKGLWVQLIDDEHGYTLLSADHKQVKKIESKVDQARQVGLILAKKAQEKNITTVVFDRGGYKYHGRIQALAEGAREGGLII